MCYKCHTTSTNDTSNDPKAFQGDARRQGSSLSNTTQACGVHDSLTITKQRARLNVLCEANSTTGVGSGAKGEKDGGFHMQTVPADYRALLPSPPPPAHRPVPEGRDREGDDPSMGSLFANLGEGKGKSAVKYGRIL